jgi:DNA-binding NarL/FixJ family response regulator
LGAIDFISIIINDKGIAVSDKKIVSYVCYKNNLCNVKSIVNQLETELPIIGHNISDLHSLFPLIADSTFHTDFITVYAEDFYKMEVDSFELIQTLDTLIKCTVCRPNGSGIPVRRNTKIVAVVGSDTPIEIIKDIIEFDAISYLTPGGNGLFTHDDVKGGIRNFLDGGDRIPNSIKKLIRTKNSTTQKKDCISLTPRQKQIFDLVSTRGVSNKVIAKTLSITESTVKLHMGAILRKYNVRNRTQLAVFNKHKSVSEV